MGSENDKAHLSWWQMSPISIFPPVLSVKDPILTIGTIWTFVLLGEKFQQQKLVVTYIFWQCNNISFYT